jgi:branched-chain amino acid transport system ATP-binding protein
VSDTLLEIENLTCRFAGLLAVNDVSFKIREGSVTGLIGPNGAGKTTCFNMITGRIAPSDGRVRFSGADITGSAPERVCGAGLARTFQIVRPLPDMTVLENVLVGALVWADRVKVARDFAFEVLEKVGLQGKAELSARWLTLPDLKMLELARALATKPRMLLLDEVMAGLRPSEANRIVEVLRGLNRGGLTLMLVEHVMRIVMSLTERVIVLHHGEKIFEGTPEEAIRNQAVIESYLGRKAAHA